MKNNSEQINYDNVWEFITNQTVVNLSTAADNISYGASCYYAFNQEKKLIIFKSSDDSKHIVEGLKQSLIGGTILPDKLIQGIVIGIQFQGELHHEDKGFTNAKTTYYKKHPYALGMKGEVYVVRLKYIKYTDSKLGFGKKIIWEECTKE